MAKQRIVIAGSGFGGIKVAKALEGQADVTVVSPTDRFVYLPLIHEMLSEHRLPRDVTKRLSRILDCDHVRARATAVDGNELILDSGDRIAFDRLVVAIGAEPNDFGLPGVRENTYSFYSVKDALLANAALKTAVAEQGDEPLRLAVCGAGFTGVEVAAEAAELLRRLDAPHEIVLLDALPELFLHQSDDFRAGIRAGLERLGIETQLGEMITRVAPGSVHVKEEGGERDIPAEVLFWCAGIRPRRIEGVDPAVDDTMQSHGRDDVWVLGDAAQFPRGLQVPKLAQAAEQQAPIVAHNVLHPERPMHYTPETKGIIASVGHSYAVAEIKGQVLTGKVPLHIKRQLYKAKIRMA